MWINLENLGEHFREFGFGEESTEQFGHFIGDQTRCANHWIVAFVEFGFKFKYLVHILIVVFEILPTGKPFGIFVQLYARRFSGNIVN